MTGIFSPVDGIGRKILLTDSVAATSRDTPIGKSALAAVAPISVAARRREIDLCIVARPVLGIIHVLAPGSQSPKPYGFSGSQSYIRVTFPGSRRQ
jgi:hypothetical protein